MPTCFSHGYALLIGAGADLPNTVDDARGMGFGFRVAVNP